MLSRSLSFALSRDCVKPASSISLRAFTTQKTDEKGPGEAFKEGHKSKKEEISQVKQTLGYIADSVKNVGSKFKDIFGAASDRASNARENLKQKAEGGKEEPEVYDARKDHECLEKGICDNPNADPVNLKKETIKECA